MSTSVVRISPDPLAVDVAVSDELLRITLSHGREVAAPLEWFPRLRDATSDQRSRWRFIGRGQGIHWPELDEDVSVRGLLGLPA